MPSSTSSASPRSARSEKPAPRQLTLSQTLRAAIVKQVFREHSPGTVPGPWYDACDGLKIGPAAEPYVVTAAHCLYLGHPGVLQGKSAFNVTDVLTKDFGIQTVNGDNTRGPVVPVTAVSVLQSSDWALMRADVSVPEAAAFNALPSVVDYQHRLLQSGVAKVGALAQMHTMPQAAAGKMVAGRGVYLGRTVDPTTEGRRLDYIALKGATNPAVDACNWGASGSTAIVAGEYLTGPYDSRNNIAYAKDAPANPPDNPPLGRVFRHQLEANLGRRQDSLNQYNTICGYQPDPGNIYAQLIAGFSRPAPAAAG